MSVEYQKLMEKVARVIESRMIRLPPKKAQKYEKGTYRPRFCLADRGGELICIWCSNLRRADFEGKGGDVEIVRIGDVSKGLGVGMNDSSGWDAVTKKVMNYYNMKL